MNLQSRIAVSFVAVVTIAAAALGYFGLLTQSDELETAKLQECRTRMQNLAMQLEIYDGDGPYPKDLRKLQRLAQEHRVTKVLDHPPCCPTGLDYKYELKFHDRIFSLKCVGQHGGNPTPHFTSDSSTGFVR